MSFLKTEEIRQYMISQNGTNLGSGLMGTLVTYQIIYHSKTETLKEELREAAPVHKTEKR